MTNANDKATVNASDSRKLPLKRSNTVYKDPELPSVIEATKPSKEVDTVVRSLPAVPNVQQSGEDVKSIETVKEHVDSSASTGSSDTCEALRSDGFYIDDKGEVNDYHPYADQNVNEKENVKPSTVVKEHSVDTTIPKPVTKMSYEASQMPDHIAIPSEPEEYWDDEEDNYEEDDYVTAPSHRYRSDNTTGGHTTVLFPKFNQKAKRELVVAKQIVDSSRTMEDWEDELWDTTMVAEYGDEIFQYMRDLEVRLNGSER